MGRKRKRESLESFNNEVVRCGVTYADIQKLETQSRMERIRAPKVVGDDGRLVYMTVAERNRLKRMADDGEEKDCAGCSLNGGENFECIGEYKWCEEAVDGCESPEVSWE